MVKISVEYQGDLHCELIHGPSGTHIGTDAPLDNQGKGEMFSPTDLVASALASCILTTLGIVARRDKVQLVGARAEVIKEMTDQPRRIGQLTTTVWMPKGFPLDLRSKYEHMAQTCPVHRSLHPDVNAPIHFVYE